MGWDAYASGNISDPDESIFVIDDNSGRLIIPDAQIAAAFLEAAKEVRTADWLLHAGGLDCSDCARMLERAGISAWGNNISAETLGQMRPNWNYEYSGDEAWAYWSARKFIETCQKIGLGIEFSW